MRAELLRGHLDLVLLSTLHREPGHGYAVITALRERTAGGLELTEGSVYPALHRLQDQGLLASVWQPVGGRRRRVYRVTEAGITALRTERRDWRALVNAVESVLRAGSAPSWATP
ncbi:MAG TPA: PadR family transcriptional regulator [Jatrophihabitantaceae bacterium]|jgi:DNA-binding PadR family transcriptional regulator|nr:PadR family transcriptional regulator [Jatrophihabitantaceae bacterium]